MKKTDIAMVIVIASLSVMVAFFVASSMPFLKVSANGEKVKTTDPITESLTSPDKKIFNSNGINPTVETVIGGDGAAN